MATATLEFALHEGFTLTVELYSPGTDTLVASAVCTERTNNKGVYSCALVDVATGEYRLRARDGSNATVGLDWLDHTDAAAVEYPRSEQSATSAVSTAAIADAILSRNVSNVEATMPEHCLGTIILGGLEWRISGRNWVIYRTDGSTVHAVKPVDSNANAEPIVGVD